MEQETKTDIRCTFCKKYKSEIHFIGDYKKIFKMCKHCRDICKKSRNKNRCIHNRQQSTCSECNGANICQHNKRRSMCKLCMGISVCVHNRMKYSCKDCSLNCICIHNRYRSICKPCCTTIICKHNIQRTDCEKCDSPIEKTIKTMILSSRNNDKKYNRYDANNFIDNCFLEGLVEEYTHCYWSDCKIKLQFVKYQDDLATIERLDNSIGHTKANCVFACSKCNRMRKSNMISRINHTVP